MIKLSMPIRGSGDEAEESAFFALDELALRMAPSLRENIQ
jgi:hypothetical protein